MRGRGIIILKRLQGPFTEKVSFEQKADRSENCAEQESGGIMGRGAFLAEHTAGPNVWRLSNCRRPSG